MTVHDSQAKEIFPELPPEDLERVERAGTILELNDGDPLFTEGERNFPFYAVLDGKVKVTKLIGASTETLAIHSRGHFTGELSMLTGQPAIATGRALGPARVVRIESADFRKFVVSGTAAANMILEAMVRRTTEVQAATRQQEKLASLGKMSAGLAHELNNPASATARAAQLLRDSLDELRSQSIEYDCRFEPAEKAKLLEIHRELHQDDEGSEVLDALDRSDREEEIGSWLANHDVDGSWDIAPTLVDAGFTIACMNTMNAELKPDRLSAGITWLEKSLRSARLASDIQIASSRISELVSAMKEYTYMDRPAFQMTDIHRGLDSTLTIFGPRLKKTNIQVAKNYGSDIPMICGHPGELNQVWTNLIDNALDAMGQQGTLTLTTIKRDDNVIVTIADDGPGIPANVQPHIFEPFYTTKPVGEGTGMGLDTVYRIVRMGHGGSVTMTSEPGNTKFEVELLPEPPKEVE